MNYNTYIFYDYETGSKFPHRTQPTQLAAIAIDGRRLEIIGDYSSYINCEFDKEVLEAKGWDAVGEEALKITKISLDTIKAAPSLPIVWKQFCNWVNEFNYKKDKWSRPICCGYNNNGFDDIITNRICKEHGPWDEEYERNALFHPIHNIDVMRLTYYWIYENNQNVHSISMDNMRKHFGMDDEAAHNAVYDCKQGAELLIKYLKLARNFAPKVKFEGSFATTKKNEAPKVEKKPAKSRKEKK